MISWYVDDTRPQPEAKALANLLRQGYLPYLRRCRAPVRRIGWIRREIERLGADLVRPLFRRRYPQVAPDRLEDIV